MTAKEMVAELDRLGTLLDAVWWQQEEYNSRVKLVRPGVDWSETYILGMVGELDEVLKALQWKRHRLYTHPVRKTDVGIELVDVLKYLISLAQEQGFGPEDLLTLALQKGELLEKKFAQEWLPPEGRNVLVTDLDGTGADFQQGFGEWLAGKGYKERAWKSLQMDLDGGIPFGEYNRLKTQFEAEGGYRRLPIYLDWQRLIQSEKRAGTFILVATARPVEQIHQVGLDTMAWLEKWDIATDAILFGRDERILELIRLQQTGGNKVALLEDEPVLAERAARNGVSVLIRAQNYNASLGQYANVRRVDRFPQGVDWGWIGEKDA